MSTFSVQNLILVSLAIAASILLVLLTAANDMPGVINK